jgi:hypothetical protein
LSFCMPNDLAALAEHLKRDSGDAEAATASESSSSSSCCCASAHGETLSAAAPMTTAPALSLWLLKPPDLGGGHGIEVVTVDELRALVADALASDGEGGGRGAVVGGVAAMSLAKASMDAGVAASAGLPAERDVDQDTRQDGSGDGSQSGDGGGGVGQPRLLQQPLVVQRYIANPKLLDGFKHDLRVFYLVTSLDPLVVWTYPNAGVVKFCSSKCV